MEAKPTDDIAKTVIAAMERDTRINIHHSPVTVRVENENEVILDGQMANIAEKRAAVDTATRTLLNLGEWHIVDRLQVKPAEHKENLELKQAVASALTKEPVFTEYTLCAQVADNIEMVRDKRPGTREITATIQDGCIALAGQVESLTHRRLAEVLMWWLEGCRYVDNRLKVEPPEQDTDNEITDAVRIILEKDPLVHASQLLVGTAGGVVVLNGSLASEQEKRLAILDAWYVPGVADVVDRIEA
ncbi:MAG: BON domain-containing protein [Gammaproteobacteria bacterium]|jgi:osmotically-inducible protein OsmY